MIVVRVTIWHDGSRGPKINRHFVPGIKKKFLDLPLAVRAESSVRVMVEEERTIDGEPCAVVIEVGGLIPSWLETTRIELAEALVSVVANSLTFIGENVTCLVSPPTTGVTCRSANGTGAVTMHSLDPHGYARCGALAKPKKTGTWPVDQDGTEMAEDVTCPACLAFRIPQAA